MRRLVRRSRSPKNTVASKPRVPPELVYDLLESILPIVRDRAQRIPVTVRARRTRARY
jgi:hypothetical protein